MIIALLVMAVPCVLRVQRVLAEEGEYYDPDAFEAPMINITSDTMNIAYEELLDVDMQPSTELDSGGFVSIMSYTQRDELQSIQLGQTIELRFQTGVPDECVAYEYILGDDGTASGAPGAMLTYPIVMEDNKGAWQLADIGSAVGADDESDIVAADARGESGEALRGIVLRCRFGENVCAYIFTFTTVG